MQDTFQGSILVHEFVHHLQGVSGKYATGYGCRDSVAMEREAYAVQRAYIAAHGDYHPIQADHYMNCED